MAYGDGSLFRNDRGTWTMFVTVDGKRYKRTGKDKTEVRSKVAELRRQITTGERSAAESRDTIGALVEEWLTRDLAGRDRAPSTVSRHRWAADHIIEQIGTTRAARLRVADVETMLDHLAATGLSRASLLKIRNTLSQAMRAAMRRDKVRSDVAKDAVIPADAARTRARKSLSPTDARKLLAALRTERNGLAFALSLRLGLRPGEAWGLHWSDVGDDKVNITRALRRDGGRAQIVDDLKTSSSKRTIRMPDEIAEWFAEHRAAYRVEQLAARTWADQRIVFTGAEGAPVSPSTSRNHLADICKRAELPNVTPNELRHSCASLLSDEGVPNEEIADLLGHTTTRMVDQTYRHRLRPVVDVAARATWATTR